MPVTATTAEEIFVGAGEVYVNGVSVGATMDNNVFRVTREYFAPELNGVRGPIKGIDYIQSEIAELEVTIPEISAARLALIVPGSTATVSAITATVGGGTTTLADAAIAGQTLAIKFTAITNFAIGDWVRFGAVGFYQYAKLTRVGTALIGGTGVDIDRPLTAAIASGVAAVEVDGNGETIITGGADRRLPSTAYNDWALIVPGLDGREARFELDDAIMTDNPEFEAADDGAMAPRLTLQSRWDPAAPSVSPWRIKRVPDANP